MYNAANQIVYSSGRRRPNDVPVRFQRQHATREKPGRHARHDDLELRKPADAVPAIGEHDIPRCDDALQRRQPACRKGFADRRRRNSSGTTRTILPRLTARTQSNRLHERAAAVRQPDQHPPPDRRHADDILPPFRRHRLDAAALDEHRLASSIPLIYDAWGNVVNRTGTTGVALLWIAVVDYYFDPETGSYHVRRLSTIQ